MRVKLDWFGKAPIKRDIKICGFLYKGKCKTFSNICRNVSSKKRNFPEFVVEIVKTCQIFVFNTVVFVEKWRGC